MAQAGASLLVDSATITAAGHCQVESWVRMHSPEKEWTVVPACHFAGTEVALGYSYFTHPGSADRWNLGVKRLWRDFDAHPWGIGFALGAEWDGKTSESPHWSAKVPFSMALDPDRRLVLHANFGWSKPHAQPGAVTGESASSGQQPRPGPCWPKWLAIIAATLPVSSACAMPGANRLRSAYWSATGTDSKVVLG